MAAEQHNPQFAGAGTDTDSALSLELVPRETRYLRLLFGLLMTVTIFEGYDVTIFHLCTPDIARTFQMDDRAVGLMASIVAQVAAAD